MRHVPLDNLNVIDFLATFLEAVVVFEAGFCRQILVLSGRFSVLRLIKPTINFYIMNRDAILAMIATVQAMYALAMSFLPMAKEGAKTFFVEAKRAIIRAQREAKNAAAAVGAAAQQAADQIKRMFDGIGASAGQQGGDGDDEEGNEDGDGEEEGEGAVGDAMA